MRPSWLGWRAMCWVVVLLAAVTGGAQSSAHGKTATDGKPVPRATAEAEQKAGQATGLEAGQARGHETGQGSATISPLPPQEAGRRAQDGVSEKPWWSRFLDALKLAKEDYDILTGVLLRLGALAVVAVIVWMVWREYSRDVVVIEPFSVPKAWTDAGYSDEVVAHRIREQFQEIQKKTRTDMRKSDLAMLRDERAMADMEVTGTKMGVKTVADVLRELTARHLKHVSGDIAYRGLDGATPHSVVVTLYVREGRKRGEAILLRLEHGALHSLFEEIAIAALEAVNPYVAGMYWFREKRYTRTLEIAQRMVREGESKGSEESYAERIRGVVARGLQLIPGRRRNVDQRSAGYNLWGNALGDMKDYAGAFEKYARALEIDPKFAMAYNNWGLTLYELKDFRAAIEKHQKAIAIDKKNTDGYIGWGSALNRLKDHRGAIEKHEMAIGIDKRSADAYIGWGNALFGLADYAGAIEKYGRAVEINPKLALAYNNWGLALVNLQDHTSAIQKYEMAIKADGKNVDAYVGWGNALCALKNYAAAFEQYRKALEIDPKNGMAYQSWGAMLHALKNYAGAIEKFEKAIQIDPNNAIAYNYSGNAWYELNDYAMATERYEMAIQADPTIADPYYNLFLTLRNLGRMDESEAMKAKYQALVDEG